MAIPPGFELVNKSPIPAGFELVEPSSDNSGAASALGGVVKALGTGAAATVGGGLAGLAVGVGELLGIADPGAGARTVEAFQKQIQAPNTQSGQRALESVGEVSQGVIDKVNVPVSGIAGLAELATGQGLDQAVNTVESVQNRGAGVTFGDRVLEETGSPLAATLARILPEAVAEGLFLKGAGGVARTGASGIKNLPKPEVLKRTLDERFSKLANRPIVAVGDNGRFSDDALRIIEQHKGPEAVAQARRFNLFTANDVPATRFNVTQKTDDAIIQQSGLKRTGPISETVARQDARLAEIVDEGVQRLNPTAKDLPETNANVFSAVDDVVSDLESTVSDAYRLAREQASPDAVVKPERLIKTLQQNASKNSITNGLVSAVRGDLQAQGIIRGLKPVENVGLRIERAEEIRQGLNSYFEGANPQARKVLRELKDALDDDVAVVAPDVFKPAREAKVKMQRIIERGKRDKRDKTRGSFLEDVLDNKIPEEKLLSRLLTARRDDFVAFKRFLTQDSGPNGVQAFNDIKAQVLRGALEKATGTLGKGERGQVTFNVRIFKQQFANLKASGKYEDLFNAGERKMISDIEEIGMLRIPQNLVQQGRGPTELAVSAVFDRLPGFSQAKQLAEAVRIPYRDRRALDPVSAISR